MKSSKTPVPEDTPVKKSKAPKEPPAPAAHKTKQKGEGKPETAPKTTKNGPTQTGISNEMKKSLRIRGGLLLFRVYYDAQLLGWL